MFSTDYQQLMSIISQHTFMIIMIIVRCDFAVAYVKECGANGGAAAYLMVRQMNKGKRMTIRDQKPKSETQASNWREK